MLTPLTDGKREGTHQESKEDVVSEVTKNVRFLTKPFDDKNFLLQSVPVLPRNWTVVTDQET